MIRLFVKTFDFLLLYRVRLVDGVEIPHFLTIRITAIHSVISRFLKRLLLNLQRFKDGAA